MPLFKHSENHDSQVLHVMDRNLIQKYVNTKFQSNPYLVVSSRENKLNFFLSTHQKSDQGGYNTLIKTHFLLTNTCRIFRNSQKMVFYKCWPQFPLFSSPGEEPPLSSFSSSQLTPLLLLTHHIKSAILLANTLS